MSVLFPACPEFICAFVCACPCIARPALPFARGAETGPRARSRVGRVVEVCAGRPNTLLIAKSDKGHLFGAFTPAKWLNTKEKEFVGDPTAASFLFSLDHNLVFPIKRNQLDYAISAYGGWGPIYGSPYGPDLSISDKCHMNDNSCSSLGSHYDIPINIK